MIQNCSVTCTIHFSNTTNTDRADRYFILGDFRSYAEAQKRVEAAYRDEKGWAKMALLNTACSGKFTSDRTIQEYVDDIWHLDKVIVYSPKYLLSRPANAFPCLASSLAIS